MFHHLLCRISTFLSSFPSRQFGLFLSKENLELKFSKYNVTIYLTNSTDRWYQNYSFSWRLTFLNMKFLSYINNAVYYGRPNEKLISYQRLHVGSLLNFVTREKKQKRYWILPFFFFLTCKCLHSSL